MLAISIRQPWCWLLTEGEKDCENRNWMSRHRGPLLIHASKTFDEAGYKWVRQQFSIPNLPAVGNYHLGGIVGQVNMVGCVTKFDSRWFSGPCGFIMANRRAGIFIEVRGKPGMFDVPEEILGDYYPMEVKK